ncbi:MAG: (2Fe-2S)-binding protein, partial [Deltaproteobacteria bacterium]|nr:(2Fe-2S)-binding protein [Deltaproteobacteria bacterium]
MPKVTIDGQSIEVPAGTTVLRAAKQLGIDIPVFCYHPGLSIAANCRMCLVEVEKSPKPLPGCYTEVGEGMVVHTQTERVKATQKAVLEFILLNHPVDCPICDQAGECVLQEHYATYSLQASRLMHEKVGKPKAKPLGPTVMLDAERCIVCTRCVRFCEEVTKTCELTVESRGEHSEITTPAGVELNNPYSQNVVDICPVGALTSRQFRFHRRVWFLDMRDSLCTGCGRGCSVRVDSHKNQVERLVPRYNPDVNSYWMCDDGRRSLDGLKDGLGMGWLPGPDGARQAPAADGIRAMAAWLQEQKGSQGGLGIALSASLTNEDLYAWARLAKAAEAKVYLLPRAGWQGDTLLRSDDRDCNTAGAKAILASVLGSFGGADELIGDAGALEVLLVVDHGADCDGELQEALGRVPKVGVFASQASGWTQAATVVVPLTPLQAREGTLTNVAGWVQRLQQPLKPAVTTVAAHVAAAMLAPAASDVALDFTDKTRPAELFDRLAGAVAEFKGLDYAEIGDLGRHL